MTRRAVTKAITVAIGLALLAAGVAGCSLVRPPRRTGQVLTIKRQPASLLVLILGSTSAQARAVFSNAVAATARTGERLIVLGASGSTLGEYLAPLPPSMAGPRFPIPLGGNATPFQRARYEKSRASAVAAVLRDKRLLQVRQRQLLLAWADHAVALAWSAAQRRAAGQRPATGQPVAGSAELTRSLSAAVADVTALQQAKGSVGDRLVLGLIDPDAAAGPPMHLDVSLAGMTVVLTGITDSLADAPWQAALLQAGAARAYVLTPAAASLLPGLVSGGLAGRAGIPFVLTGLHYGPGKYALPRSAQPSLRKLLRLLTVSYPTAIATINGYTDDLPVPGGNLLLSWERAHAVLTWLVDHHVAAYRLQAVGYGSADPVAPNRPTGQPLNRRVIVIVSPGA